MNYKQKLTEIIARVCSLEQQLADTNHELSELVMHLPENVITPNAAMMMKLKYQQIKHDDTSTWIHIAGIPVEVLIKWEQRLWIHRETDFTYARRSHYDQLLTMTGRKVVENWFYYCPDFLKSIMCRPEYIQSALNRLITHYSHNKPNQATKDYMKLLFDMLEEEILKYESQ